MKPKGKSYEKRVITPKVWEQIHYRGKYGTYLLPVKVSKYIRSLEKKLENK